jgi:6-phosphogluconate dehydrogenase (decarboxylating)
LIDGGNSLFQDDLLRAERLAKRGLHYVDCGVSGGVFDSNGAYCLMVGGAPDVVARLRPVFEALAPASRLPLALQAGRPARVLRNEAGSTAGLTAPGIS